METLEYNCTSEVKVVKTFFNWSVKNVSRCNDTIDSETFRDSGNYQWKFSISFKKNAFDVHLHLLKVPRPKTSDSSEIEYFVDVLDHIGGTSVLRRRDQKASGIQDMDEHEVHASSVSILQCNVLPDAWCKDDTLTLQCEVHRILDFKQDIELVDEVVTNSMTHFLDKALWDMFSNGIMTDVKLRVDRTSFDAHKVILSACSPVFSAMFSAGMKESSENKVVIPDTTADDFRGFLKYLYTGECVVPKEPWGLFFLADKYDVPSLREVCERQMKSHITLDNCISNLLMADLHNIANVPSVVMSFIAKNLKTVCEQPDWDELMKSKPSLVKMILKNA